MFELIKELSSSFGVSGNEEEVREIIKREIENKVDEINIDPLGNLIAIKKGTGKKILLSAHMDEIGIMVTFAEESGFLRFSSLGWVSPFFALTQKIRFKNGVLGTLHYEEKLEDMKDLKLSKMYIDIGAKSKEDALSQIKIGDVACFISDPVLQNGCIFAKALDNRCGCGVLIQTLRQLTKCDHELYFVFTVQEELGLRGAKTAAYQLKPDFAIVIDVTDTGDTPQCKPMEVKLGGGPAIKIKDRSVICHPMVKNLLETAAKKANLPYQYEILEDGGTDAGAFHHSGGGIPTGAISIPCRYIHSANEMVSLQDVENTVKLLIEAIK